MADNRDRRGDLSPLPARYQTMALRGPPSSGRTQTVPLVYGHFRDLPLVAYVLRRADRRSRRWASLRRLGRRPQSYGLSRTAIILLVSLTVAVLAVVFSCISYAAHQVMGKYLCAVLMMSFCFPAGSYLAILYLAAMEYAFAPVRSLRERSCRTE